MKTAEFDYSLPPSFIAQTPVEPRDAARLLVLDRQTGALEHTSFSQIVSYLRPGDLLVLNETRVIPARLFGRKLSTGGVVEVFLIKRIHENKWEVLVKGKGLIPGKQLEIDHGPPAEILQVTKEGHRIIQFESPIEPYLSTIGHVPLPPYIHTPLSDPDRYQTIYARQPGSVAAPTAGLHFTPRLMAELQQMDIHVTCVTLHIGLDTFAPVVEEHAEDHAIHTEWCQLGEGSAKKIRETRRQGGRVIAVGTTSVRTLESAARVSGSADEIAAYEGPTDLFILPGYQFLCVDAMVTNFHLPRSTLIMLVSAFAGRQTILNAYEIAKEHHYRFYSFGDAMLIY